MSTADPRGDGPAGAVDRRTFMKTVGMGAGALALGGAAELEDGPVGEADAIAPIVLYGGAVIAGVAVTTTAGWLLRDQEVIGADDPPEGLTANALEQHVYTTMRGTKSENASTFVDNENIIQGAEHVAWADAKIAAIEAINEQLPQSDVTSAANTAVADYFSTIKANFLDSWNESALELDNLISALDDHPDTSSASMVVWSEYGSGDGQTTDSVTVAERDMTLPDGSDYTLQRVDIDGEWYDNDGGGEEWLCEYDPIETDNDNSESGTIVIEHDSTQLEYLTQGDWRSAWNNIEDTQTAVEDGIGLWVDEVYGEVQAGDLDPDDLFTPRELAELAPDDGKFPQAVADLQALNISTNLEREAVLELDDGNIEVRGTLGWTESGTLEAGTVDVSEESGSYYLTYDISQGVGAWTDYDDSKGVDGGQVNFTAEPYPESNYLIDTAAGETAEATSDDFDPYGSDDQPADPAIDDVAYWQADVTDQLDDAVSAIEEVTFEADVDEEQFETVQLQDDFEIVEFVNTETGETTDSAEHTRDEPQDDSNYITQEEWDDMQESNEELIDKYEESQSNGGGGGWLGGGGLFSWSPFGTIETIILIVLGLFGVSTLSN